MTNELAGWASLPADTFAEGPPAGGNDGEGNPIDANGRTGPFDGQPIQGFSGVQFAPDNTGAFWFLSDNGFGAQENSTDYLLRIYQADPNFAGAENGDGSVEIQGFVQLADPDNLIPFSIINEDTEERLLTGGDFDVESFVIDDNGDIWVGEEFGPYLLHFNSEGKLLEAPVPTPNITNLNTLNGQDPLVIGHRGASGTLPEHTLEAYELAIEQGADFIEPDLVVTKDGVLIARHEPTLAQVELDEEGNIKFDDNGEPILKAGTANTTNVFELPQFAARLTVKNLDGNPVGGWYAEDFTLKEIKQLSAIQSRDYRARSFNDDGFKVPTFEEVIALAKDKGVGIYPETKHPTYFGKEGTYLDGTSINVDTSQLLIDTLVANDFTDPERIFIQSFEIENLLRLQNEIMPEAGVDIPLVQLTDDVKTSVYDVAFNFRPGNPDANPDIYDGIPIGLRENTDYGDLLNTSFIDWIADNYAEGLGPWKETFRLTKTLDEPVDGDGDGVAEITKEITGQVVPIVDWAHDAGLQVHTYTMRDEERHLYLVDGEPESAEEEYRQLIDIGVDGFFTDFPATGVSVVDSVTGEFVRSPQNPDLGDGLPNLSRSQGFEGMAFSPDRSTLYPLLEGTVDGDPENALRIYEFDVESASYNGLVGYYPTTDGNPIGDFTPINDSEFLVIERDNNEGEEAAFKKIFKINIDNVDEDGFVEKTEVVALLNIPDPNDLNDDGNTTYDMPFVTIEDVVVVDENTILVANDNNYPFSQGREEDIDNNEAVLIKLDEPLNLDPNLGGTALTPTPIENTGDTEQPAQVTGLNGYSVDPIFTVGEEVNDYVPPGILDGLGAFALDDDTIRVVANHELRPELGYAYTLANGTELTGARVSYFDIDKETRQVVDSGLAYDTIINRDGEVVDEASDLDFEGINRLCSAQYIEAHQFGDGRGLEDSLFFTGEETSGGTEFVIDPATDTMYAVPWMGRAAWESTTELDTGTTDKVALLVGDDREAAPLLLYVGEKDTSKGAGLLERNGLVGGQLYTWVPDGDVADTPTFTDEDGEEVDADDAPDPAGFNGTGNSQSGSWVELDYYRPDLAGSAVDTNDDGDIQDELGYDELGFATQAQQDQLFIDAGGFQFSRPEDVSTNPEDGTEAVLASTGRGGRFEDDNWGTTYKIDTEFDESGNPVTGQIDILYDGDDAGNGQFEGPDFGLRSPDNLDWADDGQILIQEDRSVSPSEDFGATSGEEASIWRLDPDSGELTRVAQMERSAIPEGQSDPEPDDIGKWESSGILDVSSLFGEDSGNLFIFDVQAHSLEDGVIASEDLVQGGQLAFLEAPSEPTSPNQPAQVTGLNGYEVNPIFTVGQTFEGGSQGDYTPPGILDGLGALALDEDTIRVVANHELRPELGYAYTLANGTELTGARISFFDINKETLELEDSGLAYDTIINRQGEVVNEASDLDFEGINRLCSAQYIEAHQFGDGRGLEDSLFFTGEETSGGTEFVLDPATNTMYAVPWMGRAAWESTTELDTGTTDKVAFLIGDDREAAPLLMYVGEKDHSEGAGFLERNGLADGKLYAWAPNGDVADTPTFTDEDGEEVDADDAPDPLGFSGTGNSQSGHWVELHHYRPEFAGSAFDTDGDGEIQDELGYDELGFATQAQQDRLFIDAGGFQFSRPEDVSTNPEDGTEAVLASTGRGGRFEGDNWGTTYKIDVDFSKSGDPLTGQIDILYDGDDAGNGQFKGPDFGLRSPDNLDWADNGKILIQEDRSVSPSEDFGGTSGEEASIWELDPDSGDLTRIGQVERSAVPEGQSDPEPDDIGNWETSGILDVSSLFGADPGELFVFDVQAHSLTDGPIGGDENLVQGGQLAFLTSDSAFV